MQLLLWIIFTYLVCETFSRDEYVHYPLSRHAKCNLMIDPGPCKLSLTAFAFDPYAQRCGKFLYSGCGGNTNRFTTERKCIDYCKIRVFEDVHLDATTKKVPATTDPYEVNEIIEQGIEDPYKSEEPTEEYSNEQETTTIGDNSGEAENGISRKPETEGINSFEEATEPIYTDEDMEKENSTNQANGTEGVTELGTTESNENISKETTDDNMENENSTYQANGTEGVTEFGTTEPNENISEETSTKRANSDESVVVFTEETFGGDKPESNEILEVNTNEPQSKSDSEPEKETDIDELLGNQFRTPMRHQEKESQESKSKKTKINI